MYNVTIMKQLCTMFIALFPRAQKVEATQVFMDRWVDKQNTVIYIMGYFTALDGKEMLTHATTWMNFEDVLLSAVSQS